MFCNHLAQLSMAKIERETFSKRF